MIAGPRALPPPRPQQGLVSNWSQTGLKLVSNWSQTGLKLVSTFKLVSTMTSTPQIGLKLVSNWSQTGLNSQLWSQLGLNLVSNWSQTGLKLVSNWFQTGLNILILRGVYGNFLHCVFSTQEGGPFIPHKHRQAAFPTDPCPRPPSPPQELYQHEWMVGAKHCTVIY